MPVKHLAAQIISFSVTFLVAVACFSAQGQNLANTIARKLEVTEITAQVGPATSLESAARSGRIQLNQAAGKSLSTWASQAFVDTMLIAADPFEETMQKPTPVKIEIQIGQSDLPAPVRLHGRGKIFLQNIKGQAVLINEITGAKTHSVALHFTAVKSEQTDEFLSAKLTAVNGQSVTEDMIANGALLLNQAPGCQNQLE